MLAVPHPRIRETPPAADRCKEYGTSGSAPARVLASGEVLFQAGDTRAQLYCVERGALCHYARWEGGRPEIIEFAFPGDIVGFGHLDAHISTAQAMVDTVVRTVPAQEFEHALDIDGRLAARLSAAADRDFDFLRAKAVKSGAGKPVERLASFLTALSHLGADEGRDPTMVPDEIPSGVVAEQLDMTIDGLVQALKELERRGMVRSTTDGLRIADLCALEDLARAA